MSEQPSHSQNVSTPSVSNPQKRKKLLLIVAIIFILAIAVYAAWIVFLIVQKIQTMRM